MIALLLLGLSTSAQAMDVGGTASLELGTTANHDPAYDLFSNGDAMPSRGLRGGVRLGEHVSIQGGWHRIRRGADVRIPGPGGTNFEDATVRMALFADQFSLGTQLALPLGESFVPYASVDGLLFRGVMKIDEDPETRKNTNQVRGTGLTPGVMPMGGIEIRTPPAPVGWQIAGFVEAGYSWYLTGDFGDLGEMKPGGFSMRGGAGIRF